MSEVPNIEEMGIEELKEYAGMLGVSYAANIGREKLIIKIQEALGEPAAEEPELSHSSVAKDENRITIVVGESETDKQPVVVAVNGRNYVMQRGKEVSVPPSVIEVLNNAKKTVWNSEMTNYSRVLRYPYQVVAK